MPVAVVSSQLAMFFLMTPIKAPMLGVVFAFDTLVYTRVVAVIAGVIPVIIVAVVPAVMLPRQSVMLAIMSAAQFPVRVPVAPVYVTMNLAVVVSTVVVIFMCRSGQAPHTQ
jgi:hypothetical protein